MRKKTQYIVVNEIYKTIYCGYPQKRAWKIITGSSGGMLLTDSKEAADKVRKWSTQSRERAAWYQHEELGYQAELDELEKQGIIIYHGLVSDMTQIYKIAACTVHPTYYPEGLSNVLLESAASGGLNVVVCQDKSKLNIAELREKLKCKKFRSRSGGREWAYYGLEPGIIVEELLINEQNPEAGVNDYKIFCYDGKPKYIIVDVDRYIGHKRNFCRREQLKRILTLCSWALPKQKRSSCLPIHTLHSVCLTSMNWIPMRK